MEKYGTINYRINCNDPIGELFGTVEPLKDGRHYISVPVTWESKDIVGSLNLFHVLEKAQEISITNIEGRRELTYKEFMEQYVNTATAVYISFEQLSVLEKLTHL